VDGGAWPFLVGGVICLVNSDNERDSPLLNSRLDLELLSCSLPRPCVAVLSRFAVVALPSRAGGGVLRARVGVVRCGRVSLALQVRRLTPAYVGCVVQVLLREIDGSEAVRE
jgi:hypothetical protein